MCHVYGVVHKGLFLYFMIYMKMISENSYLYENIEEEDLYEILNVKQGASFKEIKTNYNKLAIKFHPDKNPNCEDCEV